MVGVNDSQRWILEQEKTQERYDKLQNAYQKYKTNLSTLCSLIKERNIELILCTPMPYAEYQKNSENPLLGGYSLIMGYADYVRNFAKEQKYDLCDYHPYITKILQEETLYNPDCVHPNEHGHYYMAKCFLNFQGFDLGEEQPIPEELKEWCEYEHDLQNIPTTEHFIIPNAFVKPAEERFNSIKEYLKTDHSSEVNGPWFTICAQKYIETKQKQQEYIHFVKEFFQKY